jgi:hypothetical protein
LFIVKKKKKMSRYIEEPPHRQHFERRGINKYRDSGRVAGMIDDRNVANFEPMPFGAYNPDLEAKFASNRRAQRAAQKELDEEIDRDVEIYHGAEQELLRERAQRLREMGDLKSLGAANKLAKKMRKNERFYNKNIRALERERVPSAAEVVEEKQKMRREEKRQQEMRERAARRQRQHQVSRRNEAERQRTRNMDTQLAESIFPLSPSTSASSESLPPSPIGQRVEISQPSTSSTPFTPRPMNRSRSEDFFDQLSMLPAPPTHPIVPSMESRLQNLVPEQMMMDSPGRQKEHRQLFQPVAIPERMTVSSGRIVR